MGRLSDPSNLGFTMNCIRLELFLPALLLLCCGCFDQPYAPPPKGGPSIIEHVSAADFDQRVLRSEVPVLVDFYADWCGPCQQLTPTLEEIARERTDVKIVKINIDESRALAGRYNVNSIPRLLLFRNGQVRAEQVGLVPKAEVLSMLGR